MLIAVEWGPVATWAAAIATFLATLVAILVAMGLFDSFRAPQIWLTFDQTEPWCRVAQLGDEGRAYWVRVGVENVGSRPARGCVGRMIGLETGGVAREDIDPVQLRWAGVPRSRSFEAIDLRPGQREFLNVVMLADGTDQWRIVTFQDPDFDPGFSTELDSQDEHVLQVAVFADNAETASRSLAVGPSAEKAVGALTFA